MRIFTDMDALPVFRAPVVTVGSFDGVHRGHLHLLGVLTQRAAAFGGESIVVTFADHPRRVLHTSEEVMLLTSPDEKARLIAAAGVDNLIVMPFDEAVSQMPPEEFIRDFLVGRLGVRELVVGYNHRFGRDRSGDAAVLRGLKAKYGFAVYEASRLGGEREACAQAAGEEKISSTTIREAIKRGDTQAAERMLGRKL